MFNTKIQFYDYSDVILKKADIRKQTALTLASDLVLRTSKLSTPVDTGRLRSSETKQVFKDKAFVGTNVEYAPNVEFGTSRQRPQPFLRPALDNNIQNIKTIFKDLKLYLKLSLLSVKIITL